MQPSGTAEAELTCRAQLAQNPNDAQALLNLGSILANSGRADEAVATFEKLCAIRPDSVEGMNWLAMLFRNSGRVRRSLEVSRRAIDADPNSPTGYFNAGVGFLMLQQPGAALSLFERAKALRPDFPNYHHHHGLAAEMLGQEDTAEQAFRAAIAADPKFLPSLLSLAELRFRARDWKDVEQLASKILAADPNSLDGHLLRGLALTYLENVGEARQELERALKLDPKSLRAYEGLAFTYQTEGRFEDAIRILEEGLEQIPNAGTLFAQLVEYKKVTERDRPLIEKMAAAVRSEGVDQAQACEMHFGLGKAYDNLREYEKALLHFDEAHELMRSFGSAFFTPDEMGFSRQQYASARDWVIRTFDSTFFERNRGLGNPSDKPIFIVGSMRSGTTLMEQILSSHPDVGGAGELPFWLQNCEAAVDRNTRKLLPLKVEQLTGQYLALLEEHGPGKLRVTDKHPDNMLLAGFLHAVFPNARIIHMRRHPVDTCLSIYMLRKARLIWMHSREDIVFTYEQYLRLANHWRALLPSDRYTEIKYEDLVTDKEAVLKRLLEFLGLPWNEALLHHERNERVVLTPSLWQVRQGMYHSSMERWKNYEPWLGDFAKLLQVPY